MAPRKRNKKTKKDASDVKGSAIAEVAGSNKIPSKCSKPSSIVLAVNENNLKSPFLENFELTTKSPEATSRKKRGRPKKVLLLKGAEKSDKPVAKRCTRLSGPVPDMTKLPEKNSPEKKQSEKYFPEISPSFENVTVSLPEHDQVKAKLNKSKSISPSKMQNIMPSTSKLLDLSFIPDNETFGRDTTGRPEIVDLSSSPLEPYKSRAKPRKSKAISPTKKQKVLDMPFISDEMSNCWKDSQDKYNYISLSCLQDIIGCEVIKKESSEDAIKSNKDNPITLTAVTTTLSNAVLCETSVESATAAIPFETTDVLRETANEQERKTKIKGKKQDAVIPTSTNTNETTNIPSDANIVPREMAIVKATSAKAAVPCETIVVLAKTKKEQESQKRPNRREKRDHSSFILTSTINETTIPRDASIVPCGTSTETVASASNVILSDAVEEKQPKTRQSNCKQLDSDHHSERTIISSDAAVILSKTTIEAVASAKTVVPHDATVVLSETAKEHMAKTRQSKRAKKDDNSIIPTFTINETNVITRDDPVVPCETSIKTFASTNVAMSDATKDKLPKTRESNRKQRDKDPSIPKSPTFPNEIMSKATIKAVASAEAVIPCDATVVLSGTAKEHKVKTHQSKHKIKNDDSVILTCTTNQTTAILRDPVVLCERYMETFASALHDATKEKQPKTRQNNRKQRDSDPLTPTTATLPNERSIMPVDAAVITSKTTIEAAASAEAVVPSDATVVLIETAKEQGAKTRDKKRNKKDKKHNKKDKKHNRKDKKRNKKDDDAIIATSTTVETVIPSDHAVVPCEMSIETFTSISPVVPHDDSLIPTFTIMNEATIIPSDAVAVSCETPIETVPCETTVIVSETVKEQKSKKHRSKFQKPYDNSVFAKPTVVSNASLIISNEPMKDSRNEEQGSKKNKRDHDTTRVAPSKTPVVVSTETMKKSRADVEKKRQIRKDKKHSTAEGLSVSKTTERGLTKPHNNSSAPIAANILLTGEEVIFLPIENENKNSNCSHDNHKTTKTPGVIPSAAVTKVSAKTDKGKLKKNHFQAAIPNTAPENENAQAGPNCIARNETTEREELLKMFNAIEDSFAEEERMSVLEMHADMNYWEENCADVWEANPFGPCKREWKAVQNRQPDEWDANPLPEALPEVEAIPSHSSEADPFRFPSPTFSDTDDILSLLAPSSLNLSIAICRPAEQVHWKRSDPVKPVGAPIRVAEETKSILEGICLLAPCNKYGCINKHQRPQDLSEEISARLSAATCPQLLAAYDAIQGRLELCNYWLRLFLERCRQMHFTQLVLRIALDTCGGSVSDKEAALVDCAQILNRVEAEIWLYSEECLEPIGENRTLADALLSVCHLKPYASQSLLIASLGKILDDNGRSIESHTLNEILNNMIHEHLSPQYYKSAYEDLLRKMSINHFKALDCNVLRRFIEKLKESDEESAFRMESRIQSLLNPNPPPVPPLFSQPPPNLDLFNLPLSTNQFNPFNQFNNRRLLGSRSGNFSQNRFPNSSGFQPRAPQQHIWERPPPNWGGMKR